MPRRSNKPPVEGGTIAGEHIFPATQLTQLALEWKDLNAKGQNHDAMEVLEKIVIGSTPMFERLAQHEGFHHTVDLKILVAAAQEKIVRWLLHWKPKKGRLFTWFSKCAKNAFRSEVVKVAQYRRRFYTTDDNPERLFGFYDPSIEKRDAAVDVRSRLSDITCRWGNPQEIGALRYIVGCLEDAQEATHDRQAIIKGVCYAWGISFDMAKFFYSWSLVAMRDSMYSCVNIRFTEQDLFNSAFSYTLLPDINNIIGWEKMKHLLTVCGGQRVKFPTIAHLDKMKENYELHEEIDASPKDPESVTRLGKKYGKTERGAQEIYEAMIEVVNPNRLGEHALYEGTHGDGE